MRKKDLLNVYRQMYRSRLFEEHVIQIWNDGLITGEMHTGIGEEGINSGVVCQLINGECKASFRKQSHVMTISSEPGLLSTG